MYILHPNDAPSEEIVEWLVPKNIRKLGKSPDIRCIEPGDIVLMSPIYPRCHQKSIIKSQLERHSYVDAQWTHAAVFYSKDMIVEARFPRIACASIYDSCENYYLKFLRITGLSREESFNFVIHIMSKIGLKYDLNYVLKLKNILSENVSRNYRPHQNYVICSQLIADSLSESCQKYIYPGRISNITPADISKSLNLKIIEIKWVKVVK